MVANRFNFRIWDKKYQCMRYTYDDYHINLKGEILSTEEYHDDYYIIIKYEDIKDRLVLMQSTGLTDKNGKEIFEGDILKTNLDDNIYIKYSNELTRFTAILIHPEYKDDDCCGDYVWDEFVGDAKFCEIIGNIYENPIKTTHLR